MTSSARHVGSRIALFGVVAIAMSSLAWLGCAAKGDDTGGAVDDVHQPKTASSSDPSTDPPSDPTPAFEAGFEDAATPDAAPDGGGPCVDKDDPGSTEITAKVLMATNDAQNDPITVNGVLGSSVDVDVYKLQVTDESFHLLEPALDNKTAGVEMCTFIKCPTGSTSSVACNGGGVGKKNDVGDDGCCVTGASTGSPTWNCSGVDDSATVYFEFKQTANMCTPYSFSYAF